MADRTEPAHAPADGQFDGELRADEVLALESIFFTGECDSVVEGGGSEDGGKVPSEKLGAGPDDASAAAGGVSPSVSIHPSLEIIERGECPVLRFTISPRIDTPIQVRAPDGSFVIQTKDLPPVTLHARLCKGYPTTLPPELALDCDWLSVPQQNEVLARLRSVAEPGTSAMYLVYEELRDLAFDQVVGPGGVILQECGTETDRAALRPRFLAEVQNQETAAFQRACHNCTVCFDEFPGIELDRLPCGHPICNECAVAFVSLHVKEGSVHQLVCPLPDCSTPVSSQMVKRLLGDEAVDRFEQLLLRRTLNAMRGVSNCPRCETVCIADSELLAQCTQCFYAYCPDCAQPYHPGRPCKQFALVPPRRRIEADNQKYMEAHQERMTFGALNSLTLSRCPNCRMFAERISGCAKVVCANCRTPYCFICRKDLSVEGYLHFQEDRSRCKLFTEGRDRQLRDADVNFRDMRDNRGLHYAKCPTCRQNTPMPNNDVTCWCCKTRFCAVCRTRLRKSMNHFGLGKPCRQHDP